MSNPATFYTEADLQRAHKVGNRLAKSLLRTVKLYEQYIAKMPARSEIATSNDQRQLANWESLASMLLMRHPDGGAR